MNASILTSTESPLLFHWEPPRPRRLAITLFLFGSLVSHAVCFYVFQIVYPPAVALLPPPARVSVITAATEEGRTLLRWLEAEDPALAFATQRPSQERQRGLPKIEHMPSYLWAEPALKSAPPMIVDLRGPSPQPPGSLRVSSPQPAPSPAVIPTKLAFDLDDVGAPTLPPSNFVASNNESLQPVSFRVAVGPAGEIRHCFALNSSGDPGLDEQARNYISLCRFPRREQPSLIWGLATIEWGNDIARASVASTLTPTRSP